MVMNSWIFYSLILLCWSKDCFCNSEPQNVSRRPKNYSAIATDFLRDYELQATQMASGETEALWRYETDLTEDNREFSVLNSTSSKSFTLKASENASEIKDVELSNDMARQIRIIRRNTSPKSVEDEKSIDDLISNMTRIYSEGKPCKHNNATNKTSCYELDPDLYTLMAKSRDYNELLWGWKSWRDSVGPQIRPLFERLIGLLNAGAREHSWGDYGNFQRSEYEMGNDFQSAIKKLWLGVYPLYEELHAYVRYKLREKYPNVPANGTIQAHLLGNMWAQDWSEIFDLVKPFRKVPPLDVTPNLIKQQYSPKKILELAQSFFVSIGLDPMPDSFWNKSVYVKPNDKRMVCHASAWDFSKGDVRIKMCAGVTQEDLITIHHEMGHCEYYLAYKDLPYAYRNGANPGFHEAIGDTISLSVANPKHLKSVGLLYTVGEGVEANINFLMMQALRRVASLPFTFLVDQWRWKVFSGRITSNNYNSEWWRLRMRYQGVMPPVPRTEADFDPGAKYHVAANSPYISYFVSLILQFQFHRSLCRLASHKGLLHDCSIYKSRQAGSKFREMLAAGRSRPWPQTLHRLTGERQMTASALLDYFAPLQSWLFNYRTKKGYPLGWRTKKVPSSAHSTISGVRKTLSSSESTTPNLNQAQKLPVNPFSYPKGVGPGNEPKNGSGEVTFPAVKEENDSIDLKPDLKAALEDMEPVLNTPADFSGTTRDTNLLDPKSAIFGAKPMFVPNKIKDQLDLG